MNSKSKERDAGITLAIEAAGGLRELARLLGITAPTILEWKQVPAHRLLQVEHATGVARQKLRPDLYAPRKK